MQSRIFKNWFNIPISDRYILSGLIRILFFQKHMIPGQVNSKFIGHKLNFLYNFQTATFCQNNKVSLLSALFNVPIEDEEAYCLCKCWSVCRSVGRHFVSHNYLENPWTLLPQTWYAGWSWPINDHHGISGH